MTRHPLPGIAPKLDIPVLVYSTKHLFQIATNKGITTPAFMTKPLDRSAAIDLDDVEAWWDLPEPKAPKPQIEPGTTSADDDHELTE